VLGRFRRGRVGLLPRLEVLLGPSDIVLVDGMYLRLLKLRSLSELEWGMWRDGRRLGGTGGGDGRDDMTPCRDVRSTSSCW